MRFSLRLNNDVAVDTFVEVAVRAEALGFDQLWVSDDLFLRSAPVLIAVAARATSRISLGAGVLNPYSIHPSEIAMLAATLQEASGGRFLLGLGAGAEEFLAWAGLARHKPLSTTREAVLAIRALLTGGTPNGWRPQARLHLPPAPTPIYVGAMSPRMLALAGEVADGALPLLYPPEHYAEAARQIAAGANGRAVDIAACVWVSIDADAERARHALAAKIAYYGSSFAPYLLARAGLTVADFAPIDAAVRRGDEAVAVGLVDDRMLALGVAGSADDVIDRCRGLVAAGARHLSFGPPLGPDLLAAVEQLGTEVVPALG